MFLCFGGARNRLHMSMQALYTGDEMFDKAKPYLTGGVCNVINRHGLTTPVTVVQGVTLEFGPGLFTRIENEEELGLASRLVVMYHDSLRTESELVDIEEHERVLYETRLLEEAVLVDQMQDTGFGSDTDSRCDNVGWGNHTGNCESHR
jgi:hypothetical protein